jgi:hypothetical protein
LKPQHVVLGDFGEVMVLDWGPAKVVGAPTNAPPRGTGTGRIYPRATVEPNTMEDFLEPIDRARPTGGSDF